MGFIVVEVLLQLTRWICLIKKLFSWSYSRSSALLFQFQKSFIASSLRSLILFHSAGWFQSQTVQVCL